MAVDTQQLLDEAAKLGQLVAQHPSIAKFKQAQRAIADDADASRLMAEFEKTIETIGRQEQSGLPATDAQRTALESIQSKIISNIKVKALNMAQMEFVDLLRKINQNIQGPLAEGSAGAQRPSPLKV